MKTIPTPAPKVVVMTPKNLEEVEKMIKSRSLWKLGEASINTCRRIVQDRIDILPDQCQQEKVRLTRIINQLQS